MIHDNLPISKSVTLLTSAGSPLPCKVTVTGLGGLGHVLRRPLFCLPHKEVTSKENKGASDHIQADSFERERSHVHFPSVGLNCPLESTVESW